MFHRSDSRAPQSTQIFRAFWSGFIAGAMAVIILAVVAFYALLGDD